MYRRVVYCGGTTMRYRILATSLENRRCLLALGDDGAYYLLLFSGGELRSARVEGRRAEQLQYSRGWVPAQDQTRRTIHDLRQHLPFA